MASRWTRRVFFALGLLLAGVGTLVSLLFAVGWWLQGERSIWALNFGLSLFGVPTILPGWLLMRWTRRGGAREGGVDAHTRKRDWKWLAAASLVFFGAVALVVWGAGRSSKEGLVNVGGTVVDTYVHCPAASDLPICDVESTIQVVIDSEVVLFASNHGNSTTAVGDQVDVWYDPARPGEDTFVTDEDLRGAAIGPIMLGILAVVVGIPLLLLGWWKSR